MAFIDSVARGNPGSLYKHSRRGFGVITSHCSQPIYEVPVAPGDSPIRTGGGRWAKRTSDNPAKLRELMADIKSAGFSYIQVDGFYKGESELSLLIPAIPIGGGEPLVTKLQELLIGLGHKYQQFSILMYFPKAKAQEMTKVSDLVDPRSPTVPGETGKLFFMRSRDNSPSAQDGEILGLDPESFGIWDQNATGATNLGVPVGEAHFVTDMLTLERQAKTMEASQVFKDLVKDLMVGWTTARRSRWDDPNPPARAEHKRPSPANTPSRGGIGPSFFDNREYRSTVGLPALPDILYQDQQGLHSSYHDPDSTWEFSELL